MKGMLRHKSGGSQLLLFISICLVSLFVIGSILTLIVYNSYSSKLGLKGLGDLTNLDYNNPYATSFTRWLQVIQFISLFLIPVLICARLFGLNSKQYLQLRRPWNNGYWVAGVAIMLLAIPFSTLLGELNRHIHFPPQVENWIRQTEESGSRTIKALLSRHTMKELILNLVFIAGIAAVGEELLFRGITQRLLIKMFKSPWAGIIVTAIIFSAIHLEFYGFFPRFLLGILLGAIYWYSGSLYAAMLAHFIYDAFILVAAYYLPKTLDEPTQFSLQSIAIPAAAGLALVIAIMIWMRKRSLTSYREVYAVDMLPDNPFNGYDS
jgi:membrane protease YdiL (CAAX protease family)